LKVEVFRDVELRSEWTLETLMKFATYNIFASSSPRILEVAAGWDVDILWLGTGPLSVTLMCLSFPHGAARVTEMATIF
jgi:hypothetical protein